MLSAEELLAYKQKSVPSVYSLGTKFSEDINPTADTSRLEEKLRNVEELLALERVKMTGILSQAVWRQEIQKAEVTKNVGPYWDVLGHSEGSKMYLYPEEALYLIDIGALELSYNGVPFSLQRAFFVLTNTDVNLDKYRVFSQLSLLGYKVMRHCPKNVLTKYEKDIEVHKIGMKHRDLKDHNTRVPKISKNSKTPCDPDEFSCSNSLSDAMFQPTLSEGDTKLELLKKLQIIGPRKEHCDSGDSAIVDYDAFLPGNEENVFRKSTVQLPAFRLRVFSSTDAVPDLIELCRHRKFFKDDVPLVHAVVFPGHINFFQITSISLPSLINSSEDK